MKKIIKFKNLVLGLTLTLIMAFALGCFQLSCDESHLEIFSTDYFYYTISTRSFEGESINGITIRHLTEHGASQRFLVVPEYINGIRVTDIGRDGISFWGFYAPQDGWISDYLEKIFFETSRIRVYSGPHWQVPNLEKIIVLYWERGNFASSGHGHIRRLAQRENANYYIPFHTFERPNPFINPRHTANVTYKFNFEVVGNNGVYWVDKVNYSEIIEFTPPPPIRQGYKFLGWYREPETINRWDFVVDTRPERLLDYEGNTIFQETRLYARWQRVV